VNNKRQIACDMTFFAPDVSLPLPNSRIVAH
jgi:hypothetical protein